MGHALGLSCKRRYDSRQALLGPKLRLLYPARSPAKAFCHPCGRCQEGERVGGRPENQQGLLFLLMTVVALYSSVAADSRNGSIPPILISGGASAGSRRRGVLVCRRSQADRHRRVEYHRCGRGKKTEGTEGGEEVGGIDLTVAARFSPADKGRNAACVEQRDEKTSSHAGRAIISSVALSSEVLF